MAHKCLQDARRLFVQPASLLTQFFFLCLIICMSDTPYCESFLLSQ
jgi:hypothetical protein